MGWLTKDLGRLVEGLSLIARESLKHNSNKNISSTQTLDHPLLKSLILPATDFLGLTSGKIRRIPDRPVAGPTFDARHPREFDLPPPIVEIVSDVIEPSCSNSSSSSSSIISGAEIGDRQSGIDSSVENARSSSSSSSSGGSEEGDGDVVETEERGQVGGAVVKEKERRRPRERRVPSTPFSRALGFAGLGAGLAWGTLQESTRRLIFGTPSSPDKQSAISPYLSEKNAERLALALCRMRGAALKLGQMLSIQDESVIPPPILAALDIVRQGADVMPKDQLDQVLDAELGPEWSSKLMKFDYEPLAAASIGQVHKAITKDGLHVAVKIQYPGVADSIGSDIENVKRLLLYTNLIPEKLFLDRAMKVAKEELSRECDYELEAVNQKRFRDLIQTQGLYVPMVMDDISSKRVLTTELVSGIPIDKVANLSQETRNYVGRKLLELTLMELFVLRFMQTDPNWSNFLFDEETKTINLIDFGAARDYPKSFVDDYLRMVLACANSEREPVIEMSKRLGFLTGMESEIMLDAHVQAAFVVGLPFSKPGLYDFRASNITQSVSNIGATMLKHRLTPPPDEAYSLHRKLSGCFLACIKIGAVVPCRDLLLKVSESYQFGEDGSGISSSGTVSP